MAEDTRLTDTVRDLLESGRRERLSQVLEDAHAADIAAALRDLTLPDQVTLFRLLGRESAGVVLAELDDQPLHELARAGETRKPVFEIHWSKDQGSRGTKGQGDGLPGGTDGGKQPSDQPDQNR